MKAQKVLYWIILGVVAVNLAIIAIVVGGGRSTLSNPLPNPNGYYDFMKARTMLAKDPTGYRTLAEPELRALVRTNADALKLLRVGVGRECRVPPYSITNVSTHLTGSAVQRELVFALMAEGRLAELEHRTNDALSSYLCALRFTHEASRGGDMVDSLVGIAYERIGLGGVLNLNPFLTAAQCREAIAAVQAIDDRSETIAQVLQGERAFNRSFGLLIRLEGLVYFREMRQREEKAAEFLLAAEKSRRRTILTLAVQAYTLDHDAPPKTAADLVPGYLKAVPQDPVTGTNMALGQ